MRENDVMTGEVADPRYAQLTGRVDLSDAFLKDHNVTFRALTDPPTVGAVAFTSDLFSGKDSTAPYLWQTTPLRSDGELDFQLTAQAFDAQGNEGGALTLQVGSK